MVTMAIGDIAFGLAAAFLTGVLAAALGWPIGLLMSLIFIGWPIGALWLLAKKRLRGKSALLCFATFVAIFAAILFGAFYYHFYLHWQAMHENLPSGKAANFSAIVSDEPKASAKYVYFPAAAQPPYSGEVTVFIKISAPDAAKTDAAKIQYGDLLQIAGQVASPQTPGDDPAVFLKTVTVIAAGRGFWLRAAMLNCKAAVLAKFREFLAPDAAALLGGVTFGGTDGMSAALKNEMAASGTSYITAMYGYKMFVVAWAIEETLKHRLARRGRFALVTAAIVLFVAMAGAGAVVARAAIFALLAIAAREVGRPLAKRNALAIVAAGMAALNPTIITQFGFALSFASVAGIMYVMEPLKKLLRWEKTADGRAIGAGFLHWRESVLMAAATLIAITPIIVADSGVSFSLAIFASNALIGIATPAAIGFGYALALIGFLPAPGFLSHALGVLIAKFANLVLFYDFAVIKIFATFAVPVPLYFNSVASFAIYYGGLGWLVWKYGKIQ